MKAFMAEADWQPRKGYSPLGREMQDKRASSGSMVWRNPVLKTVDIPEPSPGPDELLIKVEYCGICGSDTHVYETDDGYIIFSGPARMPCILGHEYAGEVIEAGSEVIGFEKGDVVTGESVLWCGKCLPCRQGMLNQCENVELMGLTSNGAFAELITVKAKYCWNLKSLYGRYSREDTCRVGSLIEPLGCAYNGIFVSGGGFYPGAYAVVYGTGPIGLGSVMLLKAAGAARVIAVDVIDKRLELASRMGADFVFNANTTPALHDAVMDITGGWGADVQVEAAGAAGHTLPLIQKLYAKRGKLVYLGRAESFGTFDINGIVSGANSIIGSRGHSGYGIFPNIIKMLEGGRLEGVSQMITSVFPLSDIDDAFRASTKRVDGKILIKVG